ncbi:hypothetical protein QTJ16_000820 [Diplocarpon rosae]|uniref:Celp0028 effector like protein n=1 Tax=Diplocarpon rosae TaxID=946125 RepID=A0AAD9WFZ2_9HELO|nr:hypothetical protein QTJ16_000820 [Diplocarpon rosae]
MVNLSLLSLIVAASLATATTLPSAPVRRALKADEVVVFGDGREEIISKTAYASLTSQYDIADHQTDPALLVPAAAGHEQDSTHASPLAKRSCNDQLVFTLVDEKNITGTDVPLSSVVNGQNKATVAVTQGYEVSNEIRVSATTTFQSVKLFLEATFSTSYTRTWKSHYAAAYTFEVPRGMYGAVVSNPVITRRSGFVQTGCIGQQTRESFQADELWSMATGDMSWVQGAISLCSGETYPLPMCSGDGYLY